MNRLMDFGGCEIHRLLAGFAPLEWNDRFRGTIGSLNQLTWLIFAWNKLPREEQDYIKSLEWMEAE